MNGPELLPFALECMKIKLPFVALFALVFIQELPLAQAQSEFTPTGSMVTARERHSAMYLPPACEFLNC